MPVDTAPATNLGIREDESTMFQLRRFAVFSDVADAVTLLVFTQRPVHLETECFGHMSPTLSQL